LPIARKAAVSLLICVLLFAGFCFVSFTSLFDKIETKFYDKAILNRLTDELDRDAAYIDSYLEELQKRFSDILSERAIRNSFWVNQNSEDIYERSRILTSLGISLAGLQWVRFIDAEGNRIHYSTNPDDQILTGAGTVLYKNYPEVVGYIPFDQQLLSGMNMRRIVFDEKNERLVFYYPFYDSMDIRRGEALFVVSINAFSELLMENTQITIRDDVSVISNPNGVVIGIPPLDMVSVKDAIASIWATNNTTFSRIYAPNASSSPMALLSVKTSQDVFVGRVVSEKLFALPFALKALLIGAAFVTLFVLLFLIINMKQDAVAIVQNRLKELQVSLMNEYYQLMGDMDWAVWRRELEQRRDDVKEELCRGVKIKKGGDIEGYINSFFNKSWDALLAAIGSRTGMITTFDEAKLEAILSRVLSSKSRSNADDNLQYEIRDEESDEVEEIEELSGAEEILGEETDGGLEELDDGDAPPKDVKAAANNEDAQFEEIEELDDADDLDEIPPVDSAQSAVKKPEPPPDESGRLSDIEELESVDDEPAVSEIAAAKGPYDVDEFEDAVSGSYDYDVEEFEEVGDDPARGHNIDNTDIEKNWLDKVKVFEDYSASPKADFNSISLCTYTPKDIYIGNNDDSGLPPDDDGRTSGKPAARTAASQDEYIPEIGGGSEQPSGKPAARTTASQDEDIPEIGGDDSEQPSGESDDSKTEDTAWLKLAGETVVMEPKEIWAELPKDQAAAEPSAKPIETPDENQNAIIFNGILDEDPFGSEVFRQVSETGYYNNGFSGAAAPVYGEFISFMTKDDIKNTAPDNARKTDFSADPLYDVEEFIEADEDETIVESPVEPHPAAKAGSVDEYTFETLRKGTDINEIAKEIEAAPILNNMPQGTDIEIDVVSPASELFSNENTQKSDEPPLKQTSVQTAPKVPRKQAAAKAKPKTQRKQTDAQTKSKAVNHASSYQNLLFAPNMSELEYLEAADSEEDKQVIKKNRSGVDYIDPAVLKNAGVNTKNVDLAMKNLVDSVLRH
jgi:hypothetical protein